MLTVQQTDYPWRDVIGQLEIQTDFRNLLDGEIGDRAAEKMIAGEAPISEFEAFSDPTTRNTIEPAGSVDVSNFIANAYRNEVAEGLPGGFSSIWADVFRTLPQLTLQRVFSNASDPRADIPEPPAENPFPFILDVSVSGSGVVGQPLTATLIHPIPDDEARRPVVIGTFLSGEPAETVVMEGVTSPKTEITVTPTTAGEATVGAAGHIFGGGGSVPCSIVRHVNEEFAGNVLSEYDDGGIDFSSVTSANNDFQVGRISATEFGVVAAAANNGCAPTGFAAGFAEPTTTSAPVQIAAEGETAPTPTPDESELSVELTNLEPVDFSDVQATFEVSNTVTSGAGEELSTTARILVDGEVADVLDVTVAAGESRERTRLLTGLGETEREVEVCVELV